MVHSVWRGFIITLGTFLALVLLLLFGLNNLGKRSQMEQTEALRDAMLRASITCYAVEGRYPPDVAYLSEHYGITYDSEKYIVTLNAFADNLLPDISILNTGEV